VCRSWIHADKHHTPLSTEELDAGQAEAGPLEISAETSVDKLLEHITLLENKLSAEKARADMYHEQYQAEKLLREQVEQDLRIASLMHRTKVGWLMRPFRLCFGKAEAKEEAVRFNTHRNGTSIDTI
jgi:hypothetical protein